ncbi:hypothetical protein [Lactococcus allomyrinae]|uniref:Uncharacterized protein n=1 Tax=Lactococcus allomyrinae TaxID=2419773 RepID=A0A387BJH3_9LACT|nr:hypothetical protein [Lactococcus allomyrinae]AYG01459.1 hypothetical protein D7I46_10505 [Lactococcus allomyrinae]
MKKVKIVIVLFANSPKGSFEKEELVDEKDSLRSVAIKLNNEYVSNIPEEEREGYQRILSSTNPLGITVEKESPYNGTFFYFNDEEEVMFMTLYEFLERDTTIFEIENLISKGYLNGTSDIIYVYVPNGLGSGPELDYVKILLSTFSKVVLPVVGGFFAKKIKKIIFMKKMKKRAKYWVENRGVRGAKQIRAFIDIKGEWLTEDLKKCLAIDEEIATTLLKSLGYELSGDIWYKSYSEEAIINRKRWEEYSEHNYMY